VEQPWDVGEAIGASWRGLKRMPIHIAIVYFGYLVCAFGLPLAEALVPRLLHLKIHLAVRLLYIAAGAVISLLVVPLLLRELLRLSLASVRGEMLPPSAAVTQAWRVFCAIAITFVLGILTFPALGIPARGFSLAPYFIVDQQMTLAQALRASWRTTRGHKGAIWLYDLAALPLLFLGLTAGGIGVCFGGAMYWIGLGYVYLRLTGRSDLETFPAEFSARSLRYLLRTTLFVLSVAFAGAFFAVTRLPVLRGSAFSIVDMLVRVVAILFGVSVAVTLLATLLPWILDKLEGKKFSMFVGARHIRAKKSGFLTVISILSIMGVGISSCALSTVVSVMGGFSSDLKRKILGNNAHIVVDTVAQKPFDGYGEVLAEVRKVPGVTGATPVVQGEVMIYSASNLGGVIVRGIDPDTVGTVIDLEKKCDPSVAPTSPLAALSLGRDRPTPCIEVGRFEYLTEPERLLKLPPDEVIGIGPNGELYTKGADLPLLRDDLDPLVAEALDPKPPLRPGIIVGRELAKTLHVYVGDEVTLVSPLGDLGPMGVMPRTKKFRVSAIFFSGMYEYDATHVYALGSVMQEYFATGNKVTAIEVKVDDAERADHLTPSVKSAIEREDLRVRDWREMNKNLFSALKLERLATFVILSIAILVASFCIICTLLLMVTEKGKEIAILKALGASDAQILRTFVAEGVIIGGIGTIFGVATGLSLCMGLSTFGLRLDPNVYYIDRLPIHVSGSDFLAVAVAATVICTLSTIYPAYAASKLRPVEGLRYE
jgi:lipoprotein-releasing system permease protein